LKVEIFQKVRTNFNIPTTCYAGKMTIEDKICYRSRCMPSGATWTFYWKDNGIFFDSLWDGSHVGSYKWRLTKTQTKTILEREPKYKTLFYDLAKRVAMRFGVMLEDPITGKYIKLTDTEPPPQEEEPTNGETNKPPVKEPKNNQSTMLFLLFGLLIIFIIMKGG